MEAGLTPPPAHVDVTAGPFEELVFYEGTNDNDDIGSDDEGDLDSDDEEYQLPMSQLEPVIDLHSEGGGDFSISIDDGKMEGDASASLAASLSSQSLSKLTCSLCDLSGIDVRVSLCCFSILSLSFCSLFRGGGDNHCRCFHFKFSSIPLQNL